jgi:hypothetical protein
VPDQERDCDGRDARQLLSPDRAVRLAPPGFGGAESSG